MFVIFKFFRVKRYAYFVFKLNLIWTFVVNGKVIYSELIVLAFL